MLLCVFCWESVCPAIGHVPTCYCFEKAGGGGGTGGVTQELTVGQELQRGGEMGGGKESRQCISGGNRLLPGGGSTHCAHQNLNATSFTPDPPSQQLHSGGVVGSYFSSPTPLHSA